ncbi:hypothetical protein [Aeromonas hydrophila]|uniref:hypothetical protein n=1 Tax=Aeromonas hydrophila TaxID=644 RepID=UPI00235DF5B4|nr:hypothetical protein [Aeromonas hydrophila]
MAMLPGADPAAGERLPVIRVTGRAGGPGADLQRARRGPPGAVGHVTRCSACSWGRLPVIRVTGRASAPERI